VSKTYQEKHDKEEMCMVGAAVGGGYDNTRELHVMTYEQAMRSPDMVKWNVAVDEEYWRMVDNNVFQESAREDVPSGTHIIDSTWAMKKKSNGDHRARIAARGFKQVDGESYDEDSKAAPVINIVTVRIVFVLLIMANWYAHMVDVNGAFLLGSFEKGRKVYMEVPKGMEKHFNKDCVLLLLRTLYGTKQAAKMFWLLLLKVFKTMGFQFNRADPCLYYNWDTNGKGLVLWMSWVDDCVVMGEHEEVLKSKDVFKTHFKCDDVGELEEYVGCKVERNVEEGWMKLTYNDLDTTTRVKLEQDRSR
jgi:hypothetical protein